VDSPATISWVLVGELWSIPSPVDKKEVIQGACFESSQAKLMKHILASENKLRKSSEEKCLIPEALNDFPDPETTSLAFRYGTPFDHENSVHSERFCNFERNKSASSRLPSFLLHV
jgi:hypothetical protein